MIFDVFTKKGDIHTCSTTDLFKPYNCRNNEAFHKT